MSGAPTTRKPHVRVSTEQVIAYVHEVGITTVEDTAEALNISLSSARRHLDGGVAREELIRDEFDARGRPLRFDRWRYGSTR